MLFTRRPPLVEGLLVLVGAGLFVGLLAFASRQPGSPARANPVGPAIVLLLIIVATVLVVRDPSAGWYPFFYYASAGASTLLPARRAIALIALAGLAGGLAFYWASADLVGAVVQGLAVTIIGFTVFSATQLRRTNRELIEARGELARLAVADERVRIARDLHDTLGQSLSLVTLKSELAGRLLPDDPVVRGRRSGTSSGLRGRRWRRFARPWWTTGDRPWTGSLRRPAKPSLLPTSHHRSKRSTEGCRRSSTLCSPGRFGRG